jgi:phospholipase/carboxylesterase
LKSLARERLCMPADLPLDHVSVEPDGSTDSPAPAVFVLHGRGADEEDLLPVAQRLPDELHVVSLRAPEPLMGVSDERSESEARGAPQGYHGGYTWYELDVPDGDLHESQPATEEFRRSLDLVSKTIDAAIEAYDLDSDRVGLLGFSQGAISSLSLLLEDPDRYAWVVALHGYLAESHADSDPDGIEDTPVFVASGTADQIIPTQRAAAAADRLRELGCTIEAHEYGSAHGIAPDELADVVEWVEARLA